MVQRRDQQSHQLAGNETWPFCPYVILFQRKQHPHLCKNGYHKSCCIHTALWRLKVWTIKFTGQRNLAVVQCTVVHMLRTTCPCSELPKRTVFCFVCFWRLPNFLLNHQLFCKVSLTYTCTCTFPPILRYTPPTSGSSATPGMPFVQQTLGL